MTQIRKIIHVDMDAFYAAIEQRDDPSLQGKAVIVGGDPNSRGVVATCSYEAREFGVHSAMSASKARKRCPHGIFVKPRFDVYKSVSNLIRDVFHEHSDLVEPLSLDEAFLDVTENKRGIPTATAVAKTIKNEIRRKTGLTASAGVSFNKFLAKVASDMDKPDGLTVVPPWKAGEFVDSLPVEKFFGVGQVTARKMRMFGIRTGADLKRLDRLQLIELFGKTGNYFYEISQGIDRRPVRPERVRKSIGKEITLDRDVDDFGEIHAVLVDLSEQLEDALIRHDAKGRTLTLKVKYFDFQQITRSVTLPALVERRAEILHHALVLLKKTDATRKKIRLLGVTLSNLDLPSDADYYQPEFDF